MRRCGWYVAVPLGPVVLIGVALTLSVFGAFFGLPVLLVAARPWWACLSVGLGRAQPQDWALSLRVHLAICLSAASLLYGVTAALGFDDLEWGVDVLLWAAFTAMLASALYGGVRLLQARRPASGVALA